MILISLSVPLCDVLSDCLSLVCYCIQKCIYETLAFSVEKEYYCSLEKENMAWN
jgi:hypothetical protein